MVKPLEKRMGSSTFIWNVGEPCSAGRKDRPPVDDPNSVSVPATCECGHEFVIPLAGRDLETLEFTCPGCGKSDRFTDDQIASLVAQYETAKDTLTKAVKKVGRNLFKGGRHRFQWEHGSFGCSMIRTHGDLT
jgi:hypothetical protein